MVEFDLNVRYQGRPSQTEMKRRWDLATQVMKKQNIDCLIMQAHDDLFGQYVRWFAERRFAPYPCTVMFDRDQKLSVIGHSGLGNKLPTFGVEYEYNIGVPQSNNAWYGNNAASDQAIRIIEKEGYKKIGFLGLNLIFAAFYLGVTQGLPGVEFVDASDAIDQVISVKSQEELSMLKDAVQMHEAVGKAVPSLVYAGRNERELGADLCRLSILMGADEFLGNICIGTQRVPGAMYRFHLQNKIIESGDTLNILFEVPTLTGYYADFHHYWAIGDPLPEAVKAMDIAREAQEYMATLCKPGARASDIFNKMNEWKKSRGMKPERRMHGHGQGYGLVERPYFDAYDPMVLKENMFLALHPTVQVGEASVAPSSNYIVTKEGAVRVNTFSQQLVLI
ncbi:MAG: M24 family metallopeptidase [Firmicutes bacterium]|nr:M24 family metallopeptidase [Bacillota bacterium]